MMIAFEAATPFQVFNCINIYSELRTEEKADIYLYTYAANLTEIADCLRGTNIFENVYILGNTPKPGRIRMVSAVMSPRKLMGNIETKTYSRLYISYSGIPNLLLYNVLYEKNHEMKLSFYEDGVSSYYNGLFKHAKSVDLIRSLRGLRNDSEHVEEILLYEPRLNRVTYEGIKIDKMLPSADEIIREKIEQVFGISEKSKALLNQSSYVYFDHDYKKYAGSEFFFDFDQNVIVNKLTDLCGDIIVKVSPLSDIENAGYGGKHIIVSNFDKAPWEMLIMRDEKLESRCLITVCSNAVITPKSVYNREPYVLILGKALYHAGLTNSTDVWTEEMGRYYTDVASLYKNKEKFCVAESMKEAEDFLNAVSRREDV